VLVKNNAENIDSLCNAKQARPSHCHYCSSDLQYTGVSALYDIRCEYTATVTGNFYYSTVSRKT